MASQLSARSVAKARAGYALDGPLQRAGVDFGEGEARQLRPPLPPPPPLCCGRRQGHLASPTTLGLKGLEAPRRLSLAFSAPPLAMPSLFSASSVVAFIHFCTTWPSIILRRGNSISRQATPSMGGKRRLSGKGEEPSASLQSSLQASSSSTDASSSRSNPSASALLVFLR